MKLKKAVLGVIMLSLLVGLLPGVAYAEDATEISSVSITEISRDIEESRFLKDKHLEDEELVADLQRFVISDTSKFSYTTKLMKGLVEKNETDDSVGITFHDVDYEKGMICLRITMTPKSGFRFSEGTSISALYRAKKEVDEQSGEPTGNLLPPEAAQIARKTVNENGELVITIYSKDLVKLKEAYEKDGLELGEGLWNLFSAQEAVVDAVLDVDAGGKFWVTQSSTEDSADGVLNGIPATVVYMDDDGHVHRRALEYSYRGLSGEEEHEWKYPTGMEPGLAKGWYAIRIRDGSAATSKYIGSASGMSGWLLGAEPEGEAPLGEEPAEEEPDTIPPIVSFSIGSIEGQSCGYASAAGKKFTIQVEEGRSITVLSIGLTEGSAYFDIEGKDLTWTVTPKKGLTAKGSSLSTKYNGTVTLTYEYDAPTAADPAHKETGTATAATSFTVSHVFEGGWCLCPECDEFDAVTGFRPRITAGADKTYYKTSYPVFETNVMHRHLSSYDAVYVDHKVVNPVFYTAEANNRSKITMDNSFIQTLGPGRHIIEIVYRDGSDNHTRIAMGYFRLSSANPAFTGDNGGIGLDRLALIGVFSILGMGLIVLYPKMKKEGR